MADRAHSPSLSVNTRISRFSENCSYDMAPNDKEESHEHPAQRGMPHNDKESLLIPPTQTDLGYSNYSDTEHLIVQQRDSLPPRSKPPSEIRKARGFYVTRLALRFLSTIMSVVIIAVLLDTIRGYKETKNVTQKYQNGSGTYKVWPDKLKLFPALFLLGAAVVAAVLGLVLCLASMNQKVRRMTKTGNIATVTISSICLVLWIAATAYYASWDTKNTNWDLLSWSCNHSAPRYDYKNINFGETCTRMRFALWASVSLAILEILNLLLFILWIFSEKRANGSDIGINILSLLAVLG